MKVLKIRCCLHCPLKHFGYDVDMNKIYFCDHPATEGIELKDLNIIHPECKLEDYKKGE
jgi:predicted RNA-binding Zn-ribbon protein involved in translation (DUF1610 family)